jgi:hypothetical protein
MIATARMINWRPEPGFHRLIKLGLKEGNRNTALCARWRSCVFLHLGMF